MADLLYTSRGELMAAGVTMICEASSESQGRPSWTELSVWWLDNPERPFIALVENCIEGDGPDEVTVTHFKAVAFGTWARAISWFDPSDLRDALAAKVPADLETAYPDANALRQAKAAANRGYGGDERMRPALIWLYPDADWSDSGLAKQFEADFEVPWRTALNAIQGGNLPGWAKGFIKALRFFDRKRFHRERDQ